MPKEDESRYPFDTNPLACPVDPRDCAKRDRTRGAFRRVVRSGDAALPSQAPPEYANVGLKKLRPSPAWAR